ncbi:MAG: ABC transporter permease [Streptococcaceae bacterium]|jgi:peptide/nickel transport system permease protein|nr:ABC transporter permease [Streptococcaceae bacterium]
MIENDENLEKEALATPELVQEISIPPMGFRMIAREFLKDKMAMVSLVFLVAILVGVFGGSLFIDEVAAGRVNVFNAFQAPGNGYLLGTDMNGRDVLIQLILGARNSIFIGFSITILTSFIGIPLGVISGFFGGVIDIILMRVVDFVMILPIQLLIIMIVSIIPTYNQYTFVLILSMFLWVGRARLFRSLSLSETRRDYISASKTLGTPTWKIIFFEMMPNLSSMLITNLTLVFAGNIGIETTLTFLGFGLPMGTPSLGTLIGAAASGRVLVNFPWVWAPASILIVLLMLSINYVGNAIKRSADARQRLG